MLYKTKRRLEMSAHSKSLIQVYAGDHLLRFLNSLSLMLSQVGLVREYQTDGFHGLCLIAVVAMQLDVADRGLLIAQLKHLSIEKITAIYAFLCASKRHQLLVTMMTSELQKLALRANGGDWQVSAMSHSQHA
jgi:cytochrome c oxidase subunit IV